MKPGDISIFPVNTPGHTSDHLCFLMKEVPQSGKPQFQIFTGDHIIGASSTFFMDYVTYYQSLLKVGMIVSDFNVDKLFGAHSVTLYEQDVALDAKTKVDAYISSRKVKDKQIEQSAMKLLETKESFSIRDFYRFQ
mmetsp:Transcript_24502/g.38003  ORF Transcript_24502/g.38003 Transcript_24502/m.38003 type:complete len:136 (-) Transcript_24502:247-654(-)